MTENMTTHTPAKTLVVFVNNREVTLHGAEETGAEIKLAADVPTDFQLYAEHGRNLELVDDDQRIRVHQHERFRAVSGQDVS